MTHNRRQTLKATTVFSVLGLCLLTKSLWPLLGAWLMLLPVTALKPQYRPTVAELREERRQRKLAKELQRLGVGYGHSNDNGG